jgi:hypothetical protein
MEATNHHEKDCPVTPRSGTGGSGDSMQYGNEKALASKGGEISYVGNLASAPQFPMPRAMA